MDSRDFVRIKHMLDSCDAVLEFTKEKKIEHLEQERLLLSGLIRELEIIGEAAGSVSQETKERYPNVPWKQLIGMRNRLIHAYFDVDNDIIWKTIQYAVPQLKEQLQKVVANLNN